MNVKQCCATGYLSWLWKCDDDHGDDDDVCSLCSWLWREWWCCLRDLCLVLLL